MTVLRMPGIKELPKSAPKSVRSVMDTLLLTPAGVARWKKPPFQRELRVTKKVEAFAEELKTNGGVIHGIITLGKLDGETYIVDGQHRIEGFNMSGLPEGFADVRICHFDSMSEMAEEFERLNSALVRMKTDDILRALEHSNHCLAIIRKRCPFVGYDHIRAGGNSARLLLMSTLVRVWFGASGDTPTPGPSSSEAASLLDDTNTERITMLLALMFEAWGRDPENFRLWGSLNLSMHFWLWRRLVLREGVTSARIVTLKNDEFRQCMMAVSSNQLYVDWLPGRSLRERDRSPAYNRIKQIFAGRLGGMGFGKPILPIPEWASH